jgi:hypothetical protein
MGGPGLLVDRGIKLRLSKPFIAAYANYGLGEGDDGAAASCLENDPSHLSMDSAPMKAAQTINGHRPMVYRGMPIPVRALKTRTASTVVAHMNAASRSAPRLRWTNISHPKAIMINATLDPSMMKKGRVTLNSGF